ncbi:MAG: hypothetical protein QXE77_04995 [Desulfurococcaceae archaeon]
MSSGRAMCVGCGKICSALRLALVLSLLLYSFFSWIHLSVQASQSNPSSTSREDLCSFVASLYRDFGEFGCCVESPVVEPDVCYTSSNLLAEYVLRNVCGKPGIADKIKRFLEKYSSSFYDYYQVLLGLNYSLPFTVVEHVLADVVDSVRVVHVNRTETVIEDYYDYANLLVYKALLHIAQGEENEALKELTTLSEMFNGYGFADAYYRVYGKYETYKVALAIIAYRALGHASEVEKYRSVLEKIKPLATLYEQGFKGTGDLNLETASLVLIALYGDLHELVRKPEPRNEAISQLPEILVVVLPAVLTLLAILYTAFCKKFKLGHRKFTKPFNSLHCIQHTKA